MMIESPILFIAVGIPFIILMWTGTIVTVAVIARLLRDWWRDQE